MLLIEHHLEFLSLKGGCIGSSESTFVKLLEISFRGSTYIHNKVMSLIYVLFFQSTTSSTSVMIVAGAYNRDLKESSPSFGLRCEKTHGSHRLEKYLNI